MDYFQIKRVIYPTIKGVDFETRLVQGPPLNGDG